MFIIGFILIMLTLIYLHAHIISDRLLIQAIRDHSAMGPYHYFDSLDSFLR